jgi:RNA polymerase subunit RPABC4/transcription elongation factor Spt4
MSLDIRFTHRKKNYCPHCGKEIGHTDVVSESSYGRVWYPFLDAIGYYVPYEQRTEENDWYGKDMVLTEEQAKIAHRFVKLHNVYNKYTIDGLIAMTLLDKDDLVVNADW